jgi:hypothetical protein
MKSEEMDSLPHYFRVQSLARALRCQCRGPRCLALKLSAPRTETTSSLHRGRTCSLVQFDGVHLEIWRHPQRKCLASVKQAPLRARHPKRGIRWKSYPPVFGGQQTDRCQSPPVLSETRVVPITSAHLRGRRSKLNFKI